MAEVQYGTKGQVNLNTVLGAVGTGLGVLTGAGGLVNGDPNEKPVTRYEMSLIRDAIAKDAEIAALKAQLYTDNKIGVVQGEIAAQGIWNATQEGVIRGQAQQLAQLYSMTRLCIPNANVSPGWGPVDVYAVPMTAAASEGAKTK